MADQIYNPAEPTIPFSPEAEEAVLGAVLTNPTAFFNIASFLQDEDFFLLRHQWVWQAMQPASAKTPSPERAASGTGRF